MIKVPKVLHEIHGEESTIAALAGTYAAGILLGLIVIALTRDLEQTASRVVLFLMALDIGGGAVSNLTRGTSDYYEKRHGLRWMFILVHLGYAALFYLFLPGDRTLLLILGISIVLASALMNLLRHHRMLGWLSLLLVAGTVTATFLMKCDPVCIILLSIFAFKIIFAFNFDPGSHAQNELP